MLIIKGAKVENEIEVIELTYGRNGAGYSIDEYGWLQWRDTTGQTYYYDPDEMWRLANG
jgi:hypothetical protein